MSPPRQRLRLSPPRSRPYESWTPPEPVPAPEFIPASSTFDLPSFDEGDEGFDPAPPPLDFTIPPPDTPMGDGKCIMPQGFNWESCNSHKKWFNVVADEARKSRTPGSRRWLPPPTDSAGRTRVLPRDLYNLNSFYGNVDDLRRCVAAMKAQGRVPGGGHRDQPPVRGVGAGRERDAGTCSPGRMAGTSRRSPRTTPSSAAAARRARARTTAPRRTSTTPRTGCGTT